VVYDLVPWHHARRWNEIYMKEYKTGNAAVMTALSTKDQSP